MLSDAAGAYELIASVLSAVIIVLVALGIGLARAREKVVRLEEWMRLHEKKHNHSDTDDGTS